MINEIQKALKAPKGQFNKFGGYAYRSCEDIVEAVKPILHERGLHLVITDEVVSIGDRYYVKATAAIKDGEKVLELSNAYAREALAKKGMDESQITGAASSYARKYALNGLLAIDDNADADTQDNSAQDSPGFHVDVEKIKAAGTMDALQSTFTKAYKNHTGNAAAIKAITAAKDEKKKELAQ